MEFLNQKNLVQSLKEEQNLHIYFQSLLYAKLKYYAITQFINLKFFEVICQFLTEIYFFCKEQRQQCYALYEVLCNFWLNHTLQIQEFNQNIQDINLKVTDFEKLFEEFFAQQGILPSKIQAQINEKWNEQEMKQYFSQQKQSINFSMFEERNLNISLEKFIQTWKSNKKKLQWDKNQTQVVQQFFEHKLLKFKNIFELYLSEDMQIKDNKKIIKIQQMKQIKFDEQPMELDEIEKEIWLMDIDFKDQDQDFQNQIREELIQLKKRILIEKNSNQYN